MSRSQDERKEKNRFKMADIFLRDDALKVLKGKQVIFIGDSIQRNIYQDLVTLLCKGSVTSHEILKKKGEMIPEYLGDKLVNNTGQLTSGDKQIPCLFLNITLYTFLKAPNTGKRGSLGWEVKVTRILPWPSSTS